MRHLILLIVLMLFIKTEIQSCTIIMVSDSNVAIAGSNEDSVFPLTILCFIPASDGYYGRVVLGYEMGMNSVQGGMNDMGLFVDGNSLSNTGWKYESNKKPLFTSILDKLLASCANIKEVKEFFNTNNVKELKNARIPVMDKSGASMIVEWYDGKVVFLETEENYQVATNFIGSKFVGKEKPCSRYKSAIEVCESLNTFSIEGVQKALEASSANHDLSRTVYSFICDLKKGDIYIYNYHDFTSFVEFNLNEELQKGQKEYFISNLFPEKNTEYEIFIQEGPVKMIEKGYRRSKMNGIAFYNLLKNQYPKAFDQEISMDVLSTVGRNLSDQGKYEDAITFLEQNAKDFPEENRTQLELGDAYLANNEKEKAKLEYEKVLHNDPGNKKAIEALDGLKK